MVGLPRWLSDKESACQYRRHRRLGFDPWVGKIHWRRKWQPTPVLLLGKFHEQKNLVGYSPWGRKRVKHNFATKHTHIFHIHSDAGSSLESSAIDKGFSGGASGEEPTCQYRRLSDAVSIPGLGRSPGGGHGNPLQHSCLEDPMDRGAWQATVHRVEKSWTCLKRLSMLARKV